MSHVSSYPETEEQPDLFRVRRKDPAKCGTIVQKVWPSRKNRRGILSGLPEGTALFFGRQKYIFIWRDVAAVSGTVQILRVSGIRRFLRKSHEKKYLERWRPQLIVPVPLHPRKKRNRGFNQAAYLAERLSGFCGIPWREDVVRKVRNTRSQKKLNAAKRRQNLKNAYQVTADITGLSVLVVDDVYTTGSTMDAMAQCLLEAGAKEVYFLTVCAGRA